MTNAEREQLGSDINEIVLLYSKQIKAVANSSVAIEDQRAVAWKFVTEAQDSLKSWTLLKLPAGLQGLANLPEGDFKSIKDFIGTYHDMLKLCKRVTVGIR